MALIEDPEPLPAVEAEELAPRTLLLRVRGEFDEATGAQLTAVLDSELGEGAFYRVLVDLSRITLLTPAVAQRTLLQLRRRCRVQNIYLILVGTAHPALHHTMRSTGLLPLFDTRPTLPAALHGHGSPPRPSTPCCTPRSSTWLRTHRGGSDRSALTSSTGPGPRHAATLPWASCHP